MDLRHHLPETCTYIPSDIVKRAPNTIVADLNLGEFPEVTADYVTLLGVLEYIHEPRAVLLKARTRSSKLILSYCTSNGFLTGKRRGMGWVNDYKLQEIVELITSAGWTIKIRKLYKFRPTMREYIFFAEGN